MLTSVNDIKYDGLYDVETIQIYKVEYTCANTGKTIGATKRRISWRFGFADPEKIAQGQVGPLCRGKKEHEVILVWSLTSGKQTLYVDSIEVCSRVRKRELTFEYSFPFGGKHVIKVKGHATPTMSSKLKQFDLFFDNKSFTSFYEIYQLGLGARSIRRLTATAEPSTTNTLLQISSSSEKKKIAPIDETTPVPSQVREKAPFILPSQGSLDVNFAVNPNPEARRHNPFDDPTVSIPGAQNGESSFSNFMWNNWTQNIQHKDGVPLTVEAKEEAPPSVLEIPEEVSSQDEEDDEEEDKGEEITCFEGDEESTVPILSCPPDVDLYAEMVKKLYALNDIMAEPEEEKEEIKLTMSPIDEVGTPASPTGVMGGVQPTLMELKESKRLVPPPKQVLNPTQYQRQDSATNPTQYQRQDSTTNPTQYQRQDSTTYPTQYQRQDSTTNPTYNQAEYQPQYHHAYPVKHQVSFNYGPYSYGSYNQSFRGSI